MSNKTWDDIWNELVSNPNIKTEYNNAFLLNMFQKICSKMSKEEEYHRFVLHLFLQTKDTLSVTKSLIARECSYTLSDEEAIIVREWFDAYRKKKSKRAPISKSLKKELTDKQQGFCASCGQELGTDWSKIHVDHIIPWVLVGDELKNNYQVLCDTCNECKSSKTDFIFKSMINLA